MERKKYIEKDRENNKKRYIERNRYRDTKRETEWNTDISSNEISFYFGMYWIRCSVIAPIASQTKDKVHKGSRKNGIFLWPGLTPPPSSLVATKNSGRAT